MFLDALAAISANRLLGVVIVRLQFAALIYPILSPYNTDISGKIHCFNTVLSTLSAVLPSRERNFFLTQEVWRQYLHHILQLG